MRKNKHIATLPEGAMIDVPHEPQEEAALIQEVRERLSHIRVHHIVEPKRFYEAEASLQKLDQDLEAIMHAIAQTGEFGDCDQLERLFETYGSDDESEEASFNEYLFDCPNCGPTNNVAGWDYEQDGETKTVVRCYGCKTTHETGGE